MQQTPGEFHMLKEVFFLNDKEGWSVGWPGIVIHTANGGLTWTQQKTPTYNELYALYFIDNKTGWVTAQFGEILHTKDGGKTWKFQRSGTEANLNKVYFADAKHGLIVGDSGVILTTTNGGSEMGEAGERYGERPLRIRPFAGRDGRRRQRWDCNALLC